MKILLVEDDSILVELLTKTLTQQSYVVDVALDGEQGWVLGSTYAYDLIILDWSLPKLDGIELCQRFRSHDCHTPIILLTARTGSQNKIRGLDSGADDYICKPFDVDELGARIRALLRRLSCDYLSVLRWGDLELNPCTSQIIFQERSLALTAKEYRLLELFMRHSQEVFSVEDIIDRLWSSTDYPAVATVRSHLRHLRQKLKQAGFAEDLITTVRGQGYCLKPLSQGTSKEKAVVPQFPSDKKSQHLAALTRIWEKYQSKRKYQLKIIEQAIDSLKKGNLEISDRLSAIVAAHSLAGNLGQFGLEQASESARGIEQLLQSDAAHSLDELESLSLKLAILKQELSRKYSIVNQISQTIAKNLPLLLIASDDSLFIEQLNTKAQELGIRTKVIPEPESVREWLEIVQAQGDSLPDAVVLKVSFAPDLSESAFTPQHLSLIGEFKLSTPSIPVIVVANRDLFEDRLLVARHGGAYYLNQTVDPSQIIAICQQAAQNLSLGKKIMIVDDDIELLQTLPNMLKPWGFKLTTLDDPRQFWDVLQAIDPDLLVLDIEMPHFSGIELCKVLRAHPYWCKLPVLFLSIYQDTVLSNEVFASGANDFVSKPVGAQQLAHRILNRLYLRR